MAREDPSEVSLRAFGVPLSESELQAVQSKEQQREHAELYMDQLERSRDVASFWFDYSSERLTLVINALDVESVSRIVSDDRFNVEVREVLGSVQELMDAAQEALRKGEALGDEIGASAVSLSYDARTHSITVNIEVPSNEIAERARTIEEIDGFVVEVNVSIKFSTCSNGRISCTPFGAGGLLQGPADSNGESAKCTVGLIARKGNEIGILTAGHCVPGNGSTMFLGGTNANWVGTAENRTLNNSSGLDFVFLSLGNYQTDNRHNTLANSVYSTSSRQLDMAVSTRNAQVGDMICNAGWGTEAHYGAASADRCGELDHRGASGGYAISDDMESCGMNSGGAVTYRNSSASSIYIVGLVEGSSGGTFGSNPVCSNGSKFTEIARALSGAGATRHTVSTKQRTVQTFYDRMLNRVPDSGGYNWYDQYLGYGCDTADLGVISYGMAVSPEVTNNPSLTVDTATGRYLRLERLYRTMLRRQPDNAGLAAYDSYIYGNFYSSTADRETRWAAVASGMRGTSEFTTAAQSTTRRYAEPGMCKLAVP